MPTEELPILYVKPGCPWCTEAKDFLRGHGVDYREQNVIADPRAMEEMKRKSGQTLTPTLDWHGKILADFGVEELVPFLREQDVRLEDS
ncbi:MAG TPA: glutaredoxin domain-containing protein [Opitutus sp.]|nr:glutaredoxin domain-containing protein [Opitutus sp.]